MPGSPDSTATRSPPEPCATRSASVVRRASAGSRPTGPAGRQAAPPGGVAGTTSEPDGGAARTPPLAAVVAARCGGTAADALNDAADEAEAGAAGAAGASRGGRQ